jgi:hypothetical protein
MSETESRKCRECGEKLLGRSDQKFCSDQCRNAYNNKQNSDANNFVRNINNSLRRNRRILDALCSGEKIRVSKEKLIQKGFSFTYFTHLYETKNGSAYHFCYELGYLILNEDDVLIVRREAS